MLAAAGQQGHWHNVTIEKFPEVLHSSPFVPFVVHLADGRQVPVDHPDFVSSSKSGRVIHIFHGPNAASLFLDILLVTALELKSGPSSSASAS